MYEAVTRDIRVRVTPTYVDDQSAPDEGYYFWAYTVEIVNEGARVVQLLTRHWRILDATGRMEEVRGAGVVGQTPVIPPGDSFSYTSGCPLRTPSGFMAGSYEMMAVAGGDRFDVAIPPFSLDSPFAVGRVN
jgi:ApaG protein